MKGHIAFCPHFHQPHFQLHKTREEAFKNSYQPWLNLLQKAVSLDSFYINLHFSGPFLYWLQDQKEQYLKDFKVLMTSGKIGIIGGLADEPFIQLSSRRDDFLYQLKKYNELMIDTIGVSARQWQGIHLVERECGEMVLSEIAYAAGLIDTPAIFYLDAETFYESHFSYPGSDSDYCLKHFGFKDPFAKTTISHIPQELLHFALRDEIGGQQFISMPVHSQFRYQLLKRHGFTAEDNTIIKPQHYYFYIKDVLEKAAQLVNVYGKPDLEPIVVIFEDAEKFGQWSKDPQGDSQWLMEFFRLVEQDEEIAFTGLKEYFDQQGILDTYPVKSSHSYKEWENWTAKRGIRGVTFGDERLRRVISRLRDLEALQAGFEEAVIAAYIDEQMGKADQTLISQMKRALMGSAERFDFVNTIIKDKYSFELAEQYATINRVRNLVYQEDPKWASRHPSYGSSPYYDMQGLAYLELAYRLMKQIYIKTDLLLPGDIEMRDWDLDGENELVIQDDDQFLVIDTKGGCISFHHIVDPMLVEDSEKIQGLMADSFGTGVKAYNSIYQYSLPLVFTEADSSIGPKYYTEGGRQEICRNSSRCEIFWQQEREFKPLGRLLLDNFTIQKVAADENGITAELTCPLSLDLDGKKIDIIVTKKYQTSKKTLTVLFMAEAQGEPVSGKLILVPQLITSATPSDEVDFRPHAFLGITGKGTEEIEYVINDISVFNEGSSNYKQDRFDFAIPEAFDYVYEIKNGEGNSFNNMIRFNIINSSKMDKFIIEPAVKNYYKDHVFEEQSRLGYHSSGLAVLPFLPFINGKAFLETAITWEFDFPVKEKRYHKICQLIES